MHETWAVKPIECGDFSALLAQLDCAAQTAPICEGFQHLTSSIAALRRAAVREA